MSGARWGPPCSCWDSVVYSVRLARGVLSPFLLEGLVARGQPPEWAAVVVSIGGWLGIVSRVLVGIFSDRVLNLLTHVSTSGSTLAIGAIGMICIGVERGDQMLLFASMLAFGVGWTWPGLLHYAVLTTHADRPEHAARAAQTATFVGAIAGPLGFGLLADRVSTSIAWLVSSAIVLRQRYFWAPRHGDSRAPRPSSSSRRSYAAHTTLARRPARQGP